MTDHSYINWLVNNTTTSWWHDSGDPEELEAALARGAAGVTTNPVLSHQALQGNARRWEQDITTAVEEGSPGGARSESLLRIVVQQAARRLEPHYERTEGRQGYVCAQVDPALAADRAGMAEMAGRFHAWAPNIAVKLPVTAAGLDVMEDCIAAGITVTMTVSFTVAQAMAVARRYGQGVERALGAAGAGGPPEGRPGRCFSVIMIGRLDDYLQQVVRDNALDISDSDITQAGLAVTKRAYALYQELDPRPTLLVAALRGPYHLTELAGADLVMSVHPKYQPSFDSTELPKVKRIDAAVPGNVIDSLSRCEEFLRAYEPEGMQPREFVSFGLTQRTLSQFSEIGWKQIESFVAARG